MEENCGILYAIIAMQDSKIKAQAALILELECSIFYILLIFMLFAVFNVALNNIELIIQKIKSLW